MSEASIYSFKDRMEFKQFIHSIADQSMQVSEALDAYREHKWLPKKFRSMTIQQLSDDSKLIVELDDELRHATHNTCAAKFPLEWNKEERKHELIDNVNQIYSISKDEAKAEIITNKYVGPGSYQQFHYCLEVVMAPRRDKGSEAAGGVDIIDCINSTPSLDGNGAYFSGGGISYGWSHKGESRDATNLGELLAKCGFDTSIYKNKSKKRVPCVLYINLMTPARELLGGAGKTHINLTPYANDIARVVSSLAYKMPSYYGQGYGTRESYGRQYSAKEYLEDFLSDRYKAIYGDKDKGIKGDPTLKYSDPLSQSGVWYRMRPIMINGRYEPKTTWGDAREYVTGLIDSMCKELLNCEREDLGIYAKARGMMLYDGNVYPINFQTFEALGTKGVFILVIEKEGIAEVEKDAARGSAVALVHTGGRYVKYVKYLMRHAAVPCAQLTDYDADGIKIAEDMGDIPRIGINKDIVTWLQQNGYPEITLKLVEEPYEPRIEPEDEYLKKKRIELDSIVAAFPNTPGRGPEALWKYIKYKIEELQKEKGFDYSNVITRPEPDELYPESFKTLISKFDGYIEKITKDDWEFEDNKLVRLKKLTHRKEREEENLGILEKTIEDDEVMQEEIIPRIDTIIDELEEYFEEEGG